MKDETEEIEQQLGGQKGRGAGQVVVGGHLAQVDAGHVALAHQPLQQFEDLVVQKPPVAGRARARRDRRIERVDVDGDVIADARRDARQHGGRAQLPDVAHRQNVGAGLARGVVVRLVGRRHVADAKLGDAGNVAHLRGPADRVAVAVAHAVAAVDEVQMGVDVDQMHRRLIGERPDARDVNRMVPAQHHRQRAGRQDLAHADLDVGMAVVGVGVDDVGIADVDDPDRVHRQIDRVVLEVVGAGMAEREQRGRIADGARAEPGAGAILGAHVVGRAQDRGVGVDAVPIQHRRLLGERAVADERQVEPAAVVLI